MSKKLTTLSTIQYTGITYDSVISEIQNIIKANPNWKQNWTNFYSSEAGTMLVQLMAWISENLAVRQDLLYNEMFMSTANATKDKTRLIKQIGYIQEGTNGAVVPISVSLEKPAFDIINLSNVRKNNSLSSVISSILKFSANDKNGKKVDWEILHIDDDGNIDYTVPIQLESNKAIFDSYIFNNKSFSLKAIQGSTTYKEFSSSTDDSVTFSLETSVFDFDSLVIYDLTDGNGIYANTKHIRVKSFQDIVSLPDDNNQPCYIIDRDENNNIVFRYPSKRIMDSNSIIEKHGYKAGHKICALYRTSSGSVGNILSGAISDVRKTVKTVTNNNIDIIINSTLASSGGSDAETIEQALKNAPLTLRHNERAVTVEDVDNFLIKHNIVSSSKTYMPANEPEFFEKKYGRKISPYETYSIVSLNKGAKNIPSKELNNYPWVDLIKEDVLNEKYNFFDVGINETMPIVSKEQTLEIDIERQTYDKEQTNGLVVNNNEVKKVYRNSSLFNSNGVLSGRIFNELSNAGTPNENFYLQVKVHLNSFNGKYIRDITNDLFSESSGYNFTFKTNNNIFVDVKKHATLSSAIIDKTDSVDVLNYDKMTIVFDDYISFDVDLKVENDFEYICDLYDIEYTNQEPYNYYLLWDNNAKFKNYINDATKEENEKNFSSEQIALSYYSSKDIAKYRNGIVQIFREAYEKAVNDNYEILSKIHGNVKFVDIGLQFPESKLSKYNSFTVDDFKDDDIAVKDFPFYIDYKNSSIQSKKNFFRIRINDNIYALRIDAYTIDLVSKYFRNLYSNGGSESLRFDGDNYFDLCKYIGYGDKYIPNVELNEGINAINDIYHGNNYDDIYNSIYEEEYNKAYNTLYEEYLKDIELTIKNEFYDSDEYADEKNKYIAENSGEIKNSLVSNKESELLKNFETKKQEYYNSVFNETRNSLYDSYYNEYYSSALKEYLEKNLIAEIQELSAIKTKEKEISLNNSYINSNAYTNDFNTEKDLQYNIAYNDKLSAVGSEEYRDVYVLDKNEKTKVLTAGESNKLCNFLIVTSSSNTYFDGKKIVKGSDKFIVPITKESVITSDVKNVAFDTASGFIYGQPIDKPMNGSNYIFYLLTIEKNASTGEYEIKLDGTKTKQVSSYISSVKIYVSDAGYFDFNCANAIDKTNYVITGQQEKIISNSYDGVKQYEVILFSKETKQQLEEYANKKVEEQVDTIKQQLINNYKLANSKLYELEAYEISEINSTANANVKKAFEDNGGTSDADNKAKQRAEEEAKQKAEIETERYVDNISKDFIKEELKKYVDYNLESDYTQIIDTNFREYFENILSTSDKYSVIFSEKVNEKLLSDPLYEQKLKYQAETSIEEIVNKKAQEEYDKRKEIKTSINADVYSEEYTKRMVDKSSILFVDETSDYTYNNSITEYGDGNKCFWLNIDRLAIALNFLLSKFNIFSNTIYRYDTNLNNWVDVVVNGSNTMTENIAVELIRRKHCSNQYINKSFLFDDSDFIGSWFDDEDVDLNNDVYFNNYEYDLRFENISTAGNCSEIKLSSVKNGEVATSTDSIIETKDLFEYLFGGKRKYESGTTEKTDYASEMIASIQESRAGYRFVISSPTYGPNSNVYMYGDGYGMNSFVNKQKFITNDYSNDKIWWQSNKAYGTKSLEMLINCDGGAANGDFIFTDNDGNFVNTPTSLYLSYKRDEVDTLQIGKRDNFYYEDIDGNVIDYEAYCSNKLIKPFVSVEGQVVYKDDKNKTRIEKNFSNYCIKLTYEKTNELSYYTIDENTYEELNSIKSDIINIETKNIEPIDGLTGDMLLKIGFDIKSSVNAIQGSQINEKSSRLAIAKLLRLENLSAQYIYDTLQDAFEQFKEKTSSETYKSYEYKEILCHKAKDDTNKIVFSNLNRNGGNIVFYYPSEEEIDATKTKITVDKVHKFYKALFGTNLTNKALYELYPRQIFEGTNPDVIITDGCKEGEFYYSPTVIGEEIRNLVFEYRCFVGYEDDTGIRTSAGCGYYFDVDDESEDILFKITKTEQSDFPDTGFYLHYVHDRTYENNSNIDENILNKYISGKLIAGTKANFLKPRFKTFDLSVKIGYNANFSEADVSLKTRKVIENKYSYNISRGIEIGNKIYLSDIISTFLDVEGVETVIVNYFGFDISNQSSYPTQTKCLELEDGFDTMIVLADNDNYHGAQLYYEMN